MLQSQGANEKTKTEYSHTAAVYEPTGRNLSQNSVHSLTEPPPLAPINYGPRVLSLKEFNLNEMKTFTFFIVDVILDIHNNNKQNKSKWFIVFVESFVVFQ